MLTGVRNHIVLSGLPDSEKLRRFQEDHEGIEIIELENGEVIVTSFVKVSPHEADLCLSLRTASATQRLDLDQLQSDGSE